VRQEGVEGCERREVNRMVGVYGQGLVWKGAHADVDALRRGVSWVDGIRNEYWPL
jgi:hypothetical protein